MKRAVYILLIFLTSLVTTDAQARRPYRPKILEQHQTFEGHRILKIRNRGKTGWLFIECQNCISLEPIRIPHGTHTVELKTNELYRDVSPPPCVVHKWIEQENVPPQERW